MYRQLYMSGFSMKLRLSQDCRVVVRAVGSGLRARRPASRDIARLHHPNRLRLTYSASINP